MNIDRCILDKIHGSFRHAVKSLSIDIKQFAVGLHGFFKLLSARKEDHKELLLIVPLEIRQFVG